MDNENKGRIMKDELRSAVAEAMADKSESQAEMGGVGNSGKPIFCPTYLSAILPLGCEPCIAVKASQCESK